MIRPSRLARDFFFPSTLEVAKSLLGKFLIHEYHGQKIGGMIVETEAYVGKKDKASHAYKGKRTQRNEVEYGSGGHVYIYLVYGLHLQLNFVTAGRDEPECVLVRALEPVDSLDLMKKFRQTNNEANLTNGPGKLCQALNLNRSLNGHDLCEKSSHFYIEDRGIIIPSKDIKKAPRIGIDYAGPYWSKIHWRFFVKDNPFVSK
ncbi:MAG: DNA-3-methyladenine glycosylase [Candidatus Margulisiibacteriota bacterium]